MPVTLQPCPIEEPLMRNADRLYYHCLRALQILLWKRRPLYHRDEPPPPRISLNAREWYRKYAGRADAFYLLDPQSRMIWEQQEYLVPHRVLKENAWAEVSLPLAETFVLKIMEGRVIGRHGAILDNNNVLIKDLSRTPVGKWNDHYLLHETSLKRVRRREGRYAVVAPKAHSTFHWLYECLPRFALLERAGYPLEAFDGFFLVRPKYKAHYETLALLGIPLEDVVWTTQRSHFGADELVVPSYCGERHVFHPWVLSFLRDLAGVSGQKVEKRRRIYISRRDAKLRRIANEDEVVSHLQEYGFEEVTLSNLSFLDQAKVFASAEFVVSPHGGGLSNLCFGHQPCKVIELFAPDYVGLHYCFISMLMGFDYEPLVGEQVVTDKQKGGADIRLSIKDLRRVVETMLQR